MSLALLLSCEGCVFLVPAMPLLSTAPVRDEWDFEATVEDQEGTLGMLEEAEESSGDPSVLEEISSIRIVGIDSTVRDPFLMATGEFEGDEEPDEGRGRGGR